MSGLKVCLKQHILKREHLSRIYISLSLNNISISSSPNHSLKSMISNLTISFIVAITHSISKLIYWFYVLSHSIISEIDSSSKTFIQICVEFWLNQSGDNNKVCTLPPLFLFLFIQSTFVARNNESMYLLILTLYVCVFFFRIMSTRQ